MKSILTFMQAYLDLHPRFRQIHTPGEGLFLLIMMVFLPRTAVLLGVATPVSLIAGAGCLIVPRLITVALVFLVYWNTSYLFCFLAVVAMVLAKAYDVDLEKTLVKKGGAALGNQWDDIPWSEIGVELKENLRRPAKVIFLLGGVLLAVYFGLKVLVGIPTTNAIAFGVVVTLLTGMGLFFVRQKLRFWYGVFEILSALALGGYTVASAFKFKLVSTGELMASPERITVVLGLLSSVYIVVRGLDNVSADVKAKIFWIKLKPVLGKLKRLWT